MSVIRSRISVNTWLKRTPTVDEARPAACVDCGAAARPAGGALMLHGHGLRDRQLRGPPTAQAPPAAAVIACRRYRCQRCAAVHVVLPSEAVPRRHYAATAIAFALALYGTLGRPQHVVRAAVSAVSVVGVSALRRWRTLPRWIDALAARALFPSLPPMPRGEARRTIAARAAMAIGAHAPPSLPEGAPQVRAFVGVVHMP